MRWGSWGPWSSVAWWALHTWRTWTASQVGTTAGDQAGAANPLACLVWRVPSAQLNIDLAWHG